MLFCIILYNNNIKAQNIKQILNKAKEAIYSGDATKIDFSWSYQLANGNTVPSTNGEITLQGENFRMLYDKFIATFSNNTLVSYNKDQNTLSYSSPTKDELILINPFYFIDNETKYFTITKLPASKTSDILLLSSKKKSNISSIKVYFNRVQGYPNRIEIKGVDNSTLIIKILSIEKLKAYPASFFELKPSDYPSAEIVDLR